MHKVLIVPQYPVFHSQARSNSDEKLTLYTNNKTFLMMDDMFFMK